MSLRMLSNARINASHASGHYRIKRHPPTVDLCQKKSRSAGKSRAPREEWSFGTSA